LQAARLIFLSLLLPLHCSAVESRKKKKERWFDNGTSRRKKSSIAD
jgi:hypothetical protein